jgi:hypothetical protein
MATTSESKLFTPIKIGPIQLKHRVVMAPLTRSRSEQPGDVPGPGESSPQHSHPCPVIGYVVQGAYRSQIEGEPEEVYKAGDTFYEAPNGLHVLSANASKTEPAAFIAVFVCDRDSPLSTDFPVSRGKTRDSQ